MKTLLTRMKSAVQGNTTLNSYVDASNVRVVAPRALPLLAQDSIPFIGLAPIDSPEVWVAQKKEVTHIIEAYLVLWHLLEEDSIIGSDARKGILDLIADFEAAVRGSFFASEGVNYLSKPTDITGVSYTTEPYGDDYYLIIATVTLSCVRLFIV